MASAGPTIGACLGEPVPGSVIWKAVHRVESVSEGASGSPPRLDLRERQLPWAAISISFAVVPGKGPRFPSFIPSGFAGGDACARDASDSTDRPILRVGTATKAVAEKRNAGDGVGRVGPGGRASWGRNVAASNVGGIGSGFR